MDVTRRRAARLRGVFVGAIAAASAVAGHALGGAPLPGGTSIALVVLSSAGIGAVAAADPPHGIAAVFAYVSVGQLVGHYALEFSGGHQHAHGWSAAMASAHVLAAVIAAVVICTAEQLFAAVAAVVWQLVIVTPTPSDAEPARSIRGDWWAGAVALRGVVGRGRGMRAPPALSAA